MDTSRSAADKAILDLLRKAGVNGLHVDDLIETLHFDHKKQILPRLYALSTDNRIQKVEGKQIWVIKSDITENSMVNPLPIWMQSQQQDSSNQQQFPSQQQQFPNQQQQFLNQQQQFPSQQQFPNQQQQFRTQQQQLPNQQQQLPNQQQQFPNQQQQFPNQQQQRRPRYQPPQLQPAQPHFTSQTRQPAAISTTRGAISRPQPSPSQGFISYKNLLQEDCQKKHIPTPSYRTEKDDSRGGYIGIVICNLQEFRAKTHMFTTKEAEQRVAFDVLQIKNILPSTAQFDVQPPRSSLQSPANEQKPPLTTVSSAAKHTTPLAMTLSQFNPEISYKSKLNEFAQKSNTSISYKDTNHTEGFIATVTIGDNKFNSLQPMKQKKLAQQSAAFVALRWINGGSEQVQKVQQANLPYTSTHGPGLNPCRQQEPSLPDKSINYKGRLQEFLGAQIVQHRPSYNTEKKEIGGNNAFESTVTIDGRSWKGRREGSKKQAEQDAARTAMLGLRISIER
eukprot:gene18699-20587_t